MNEQSRKELLKIIADARADNERSRNYIEKMHRLSMLPNLYLDGDQTQRGARLMIESFHWPHAVLPRDLIEAIARDAQAR